MLIWKQKLNNIEFIVAGCRLWRASVSKNYANLCQAQQGNLLPLIRDLNLGDNWKYVKKFLYIISLSELTMTFYVNNILY